MNNKTLTLGSLFSGSGGFELGGLLAGVQPVWNCEIEPFPIRVTTKRMPQVRHFGDISSLNGAELPPVDIITGGFPCQSVSVAGKREGVQHIEHGGEKTTRSGLFYEAVRIIKEMREATHGEKPRYFVVENVMGLFSSRGGEDFKAVLEEIIRIAEPDAPALPMPEKGRWPHADLYMGDGWSVAYRTMSAEYWGVPQRRKRIYLVADFGGRGAGKILFESEGLSGYSPESLRARQGAAAGAEGRAGATGLVLNDQGGARMGVSAEVTDTLRAEARHPPCVLESAGFCTEHSAKSRTIGYEEERSPTLRAGIVPAAIYGNHSQDTRYTGPLDVAPPVTANYGEGGNNQPFVVKPDVPITMKIRGGGGSGGKGILCQEDRSATLSCNNDQTLFEPKCYGLSSKDSNAMKSDNPHSGVYETATARTLDGNANNPGCNQGGLCICEPVYALQGSMIGRKDENGPQGDGVNEDVCFTLDTADRHAVCAPENVYAMTTGSFMQVEKDLSPTLMARDYKDPAAIARVPAEITYAVRRLTPTECAKLQGFEPDWARNLGTEDPTDEELSFWTDVFETQRRIVTHAAKPKTEKQIRRWLADPHTDSAEYKMWGNGLFVGHAYFVLAGIVWYAQSCGK